jgi:hypothetical protein
MQNVKEFSRIIWEEKFVYDHGLITIGRILNSQEEFPFLVRRCQEQIASGFDDAGAINDVPFSNSMSDAN